METPKESHKDYHRKDYHLSLIMLLTLVIKLTTREIEYSSVHFFIIKFHPIFQSNLISFLL